MADATESRREPAPALIRPSPSEAVACVVGALQRLDGLELLPPHAVHRRVLAKDLHTPVPLPPWTNAAMDGYAVHGAEIRGATLASPRTLRVIDEVRAGGTGSTPLAQGQAIRIFTGAPVPGGADTVVRQEDVRRVGADIQVLNDRDCDRNVRARGNDLAVGALALRSGTRLGGPQVGMLAAMGTTEVPVCRLPRVGILVTGDEVLPAGETEAIRAGHAHGDFNGTMLRAMVEETGGLAVPLGIVGDNPDAIRQAISSAPPLDLLLTSGGVSVGDYDFLPSVMDSLGLDLRFRRVRLRPGGPVTFGILPSGLPWLGLPGNPVSSFVTFTLFAVPAIRILGGVLNPLASRLTATIEETIARDPVLDLYLRVKIIPQAGLGLSVARVTGAQGSGMLSSIVAADALLVVEAGNSPALPGEVFHAIPCVGSS